MKLSTPLTIALYAIAVLAISVWWQFDTVKQGFGDIDLQPPKMNVQLPPQIQNLTANSKNNGQYKDFIGPDGNISFRYSPSFQTGDNLFGQETNEKLKLNNVLLFVYRVTVPDLQPAYIIAAESDVASASEIAGQAQQAFLKQQCIVNVETATSTNAIISETIDAAYECPMAQEEMSQWHAQIAIIKKTVGTYYVTAVTTKKNWPLFQSEIQSLFESIKTRQDIANIEESKK